MTGECFKYELKTLFTIQTAATLGVYSPSRDVLIFYNLLRMDL